jgi:diphosphomevalonate decarboxylase
MTETLMPPGFEDILDPMRRDHARILATLARHGLGVEDWPRDLAPNPSGAAAAKAYPIQGVLKYHGLADWRWRTAYLPSISVNNDAAYSLTLVAFDPAREADEVLIGGRVAQGRERERVVGTLDALRAVAGVPTCALVASHNVVRATRTGKGLGTSASASAALAAAGIAALFGRSAAANTRFLSCMARLLAGSGCRSATGGLSLWLSYPGIAHEESYALRLDQRGQLDDLALITVPVDSRIGLQTELAHHEAPLSPFFKPWMLGRGDDTIECIEAAQAGDWRTIGQLAELDSIRLHGVTMSASRENKLFAWEPENIALFRLCNTLRGDGVPVYFSTDTGPTTVFLTHRRYIDQIVAGIRALNLGLEAVSGSLAGPAELLDVIEARRQLGLG